METEKGVIHNILIGLGVFMAFGIILLTAFLAETNIQESWWSWWVSIPLFIPGGLFILGVAALACYVVGASLTDNWYKNGE